jgi:hypothetical protein
MRLTSVIIKDQVIENERVELVDSEGLYFLGPNLTLRQCTLVLRVPTRRLHVVGARFLDCTFEVKTPLKNFRWDEAHLKGCRFKGRFSGNDFGEWPYALGKGSIEDCDFTEARLDATRFLACDVRTIRFPPWPCFTIYDPIRRAPDLRALPWLGEVGSIRMADAEGRPTTSVALTYFAPDLAKRCGTTPEALKAVLEKIDGVFY